VKHTVLCSLTISDKTRKAILTIAEAADPDITSGAVRAVSASVVGLASARQSRPVTADGIAAVAGRVAQIWEGKIL
jgi:hypothetical protein